MKKSEIIRNIINDDCYYYTKHSVIEIVNFIFDEREVQLKAKDEEIERLNCRAYHAEGYISDLHNHPKDKKFYDAKARSIVAMLFWEWKKAKREAKALMHTEYQNGFRDGKEDIAEELFKQAYKMLKDNK